MSGLYLQSLAVTKAVALRADLSFGSMPTEPLGRGVSVVGRDDPDALKLLRPELLALVTGGISTGLDSGVQGLTTVGNVPVLNGRQLLADRAYRK